MRPQSLRLGVEALETRECPTTASLYNGVLTVQGTEGFDTIVVTRHGSSIHAAGQAFDVSSVRQLVITAGAGNDTIRDASDLSAIIYGGVGNDLIRGGRGHDIIYGGHGDDIISGDRGSDQIWGGSGYDTIDAGPGIDTVDYSSPVIVSRTSAIEAEILTLINAYRVSQGRAPLAINEQLNAAADLHARDMIAISSRYGPLASMQHQLHGTTRPAITDRLDAVGYDDWTRAFRYGENIAYGYARASQVVAAWIASPAHRANILDAGFTETGIAVRLDAMGRLCFTQDFGYRR